MTDSPNGVQIVKLSDLLPDRSNANLHSERGGYMVNRSLTKLGGGRGILLDRDNEIIAGNLTVEEAVAAGFEEVVIVDGDGKRLIAHRRTDMDLDDPDTGAREMAYADNRASAVSYMPDVAQIAADVGAGFDVSDWWHVEELIDLGVLEPEPVEDPGPQIDRAEELREKWQTERGQMWALDGHRVMCGDANEDIPRLIELPRLLLTDPPYGINIVKGDRAADGGSKPVTIGTIRPRRTDTDGGVKNRGTVGAANMVDATLYRPVAGDDKPFNPEPLLGVADHVIMWGGNYFASRLPDSRCWLVWDKNNTGNFADAELAWTSFDASVKMYRHTWNGLVREGERRLEGVKRYHPTQKPVGLLAQILGDFSAAGDSVLDCYLGSGSTLLACEETGRNCYGLEIDPAYVAVTLQRWADATGREPELL